jgi:hypothetical protein
VPLPKTYTERCGVYMRGEQRAELQAKLPAHVGIGAALRDAGLRSIGREDLVLESRDESGHRKPGRSEAEFVTAVVYMTREQKQAMDAFAKSSGRSRRMTPSEAGSGASAGAGSRLGESLAFARARK